MRVLVLFIVFLSLSTHGIEANYLRLSQEDSPSEAYKIYIGRVRRRFSNETHQLYGIPVLKHSVSNSKRFYFMKLVSTSDESITIAVDYQNVRAAAYQPDGSNQSYFFPNAPQVAFDTLFSDTHRNLLSFDNTFQSIENAAGTTRQKTLLGESHLDAAIINLFHHRRELVPVSFLVIFQMMLEALKFKFIEQRVSSSLRNQQDFTPGLAILSLQDNWSQLSLQIQASTSIQGVFGNVIWLYNSNNELIEVDSIYHPIILPNVALQLYQCDVNYIKMMGEGDKKSPCYLEARTTRISGPEGFCADVDRSHLILYPCGPQANQKWTFHSDGTIRSLGKCLATNKSRFGNSLVVYDCGKVAREDITWDVSISGTIRNPSNDELVLTSKNAAKSAKLTMEVNTNAASQGWRVGDYVKPFITTIVGVEGMCLEATNGQIEVWLKECEKDYMKGQYWALYSDGTIRVNSDHRQCLTSSDSSSKDITIVNCNGSANQRWVFMADGTISTAENEKLVMDVAQGNADLQKIILYPRNGQRNQQWSVFY